jgi:hypothetical protein
MGRIASPGLTRIPVLTNTMHAIRIAAAATDTTSAALLANKPASATAKADGISSRIGHRSQVSTSRSLIEMVATPSLIRGHSLAESGFKISSALLETLGNRRKTTQSWTWSGRVATTLLN